MVCCPTDDRRGLPDREGPTVAVAQPSRTEEIESLVDAERRRLLAVLDPLDDAGWQAPSLCAGWAVRHVVSHLLMPYEASTPVFLARMLARRFAFDRVADDWARRDRRSPRELVQALR